MQNDERPSVRTGPLTGFSIIDIATVLAAPFAATLCADLGADVLKIELPNGSDTLRSIQPSTPEYALHWKVTNRGKRGMTLDIRTPRGREVFLQLLPQFDVLVENFRTGKLDSWGLDIDTLHVANPRLIVLRLTGFGQTGPYAMRPGFARIFEAMSGFANLNGEPGRSPQHMNYPLSDMIAGVFGGFSIAAAMADMAKNPNARGREIDLSATEAVFRLLETLPVEFEHLGVNRQRTGSRATYSVPSNIYKSKDGVWLTVVASSEVIFKRLCVAIGRTDMLGDARFNNHHARFSHIDEVDGTVSDWAASRPFAEISATLESHEVPHSKVNDISDVLQDPQFVARKAVIRLADPELGSVPAPCVVPRIPGNPEPTRAGPLLGQDTDAVLTSLGYTEEQIRSLKSDGAI